MKMGYCNSKSLVNSMDVPYSLRLVSLPSLQVNHKSVRLEYLAPLMPSGYGQNQVNPSR